MNFNSLEFLIFLPIVLLGYWFLPNKVKWVFLLVASYIFYMSWNVWLVFLILGTTAISYLAGLIIEKTNRQVIRKITLIFSIVICLGLLVFFKYFNFLIQTIIDFLNIFSFQIEDYSLNILLPIGISFYTFQTLSYVIDVYKGTFKAEKHFGYYALYVSFFPQLVAGPIERPGDLLPQFKNEKKFSFDDFFPGLRIIIVGFFYKCAVADFLGIYVNHVFNDLVNANSLSILLAGLLFLVQMYCDFAGYAEIATGSARMLGIRLSRNFDRPFMALNYSDFFRRWHMTLTRWFKDYLYIPLGGSKKGLFRKILNTFIVFLLCGLWHGANWTYVLWGLYTALIISIENVLKKPLNNFFTKECIDINKPLIKVLRNIGTFFVLIPGGLIFRAADVSQICELFVKLFTCIGFGNEYFNDAMNNMGIDVLSIVQVVLSIITIIKIYDYGEIGRNYIEPKLDLNNIKTRSEDGVRIVIAIYSIITIMLVWIGLLSMGATSEFQYFQF